MVCVVIVFAIVMVQKEKGTLVKQAKAVTKDMVYENAYICLLYTSPSPRDS